MIAVLVGCALLSCSDDDENWEYVGLRQVWADCYEWSGSGAKPPTDTSVWCEHKVSPPFHAGRLLLVALGPDGSTVSDTLLVLP